LSAKKGIGKKQIFAIFCNNIANTHEEIGQIDKGEKMLQRVIYYFLFLSNKSNVDKSVIQNELKRAYLKYKDFADKNNLT